MCPKNRKRALPLPNLLSTACTPKFSDVGDRCTISIGSRNSCILLVARSVRVCYVLNAQKKFALTEESVIFLFTTIFVTDLFEILKQTGLVARVVLMLLLFFSVVSWAMILQKLGMFGRTRLGPDGCMFRAWQRGCCQAASRRAWNRRSARDHGRRPVRRDSRGHFL